MDVTVNDRPVVVRVPFVRISTITTSGSWVWWSSTTSKSSSRIGDTMTRLASADPAQVISLLRPGILALAAPPASP